MNSRHKTVQYYQVVTTRTLKKLLCLKIVPYPTYIVDFMEFTTYIISCLLVAAHTLTPLIPYGVTYMAF